MKTDFECIYDWLAGNSKQFSQLDVISSVLKDKVDILQPNSTAQMYQVEVTPYKSSSGGRYVFTPTEPYYFDVDIICYRAVYEADVDRNLRQLARVQSVCDWLIEQQNAGSCPVFEQHECIQIECLTPVPFVRNVYESDSDSSKAIVDYAVTVRFYIVNPAEFIIKAVRK